MDAIREQQGIFRPYTEYFAKRRCSARASANRGSRRLCPLIRAGMADIAGGIERSPISTETVHYDQFGMNCQVRVLVMFFLWRHRHGSDQPPAAFFRCGRAFE